MNDSFKDLFNSQENNLIPNNQIIKAIVLEVTTKGNQRYVSVDTGLKKTTLIKESEFSEPVKKGDEIEVYVSESNGIFNISYIQANKIKHIEYLRKCYQEKKVITAFIEKKHENGYVVNLGQDVRGFLPLVHSSTTGDGHLSFKNKQEIVVLITKITSSSIPRINVSLRGIRQDTSHIHVDSIIEAKVVGKNDFFVFLAYGSIEILMNIRDIDKNKEINIGDKVRVKVLKNENNRVLVGMKQLHYKDWKKLFSSYQVGQECVGKVKTVEEKRLLIELEPEFYGVVYIKNLSWLRKDRDINFKVGDDIKCEVINIDEEKRRIELSAKKFMDNPFEKFVEKHSIDTVISAVVSEKKEEFCYMELGDGIEGTLSMFNLALDRNTSLKKFDELQVGDRISVKIIDFIKEKCRIVLSVRHIYENSFNNHKVGEEVTAVVTDNKRAVIMCIVGDLKAIIKRNEIPFNVSLNIGDSVKAHVVKIDRKFKVLELSISEYERSQNSQFTNVKEHSETSFGDLFKV
jgi:small subunit ribosomal protein S1